MKKFLLAVSIFFIGSSFINAQSALNFDASNQWSYVDAGTTFTNNLTGSSSITVEAWINLASPNFKTVCGNYDGSDMQFLMRTDGGKLTFFISNGTNTGCAGTSILPTGVWTHVAGTWDGTDIKVYVNGVLENTTPKSGLFPNSGHPLIIGNSKITGSEGFDGDIDDLRIWSCAKSQAEISANMNKLHDGSEGMLAYYDFENGTGTTLTDVSGNGYTGTLMHTSSGPLPSWVTGKSLTGSPSYPSYAFSYAASSYSACDTDPTPTLTTGLPGEIFSAGAGLIINASTGEIDVSASTPGTYSVSYGSCIQNNVAITINNAVTATDTQAACNSYTWIDGNTYTANNNSATFNIIGGAANGCDSLVTLNLTIVNATSGSDTRTECNSYTWIDGNTYTANNNTATFTIVGGAANGCDSLVTLDLTIVNATSGTDTRTECSSYTWIDGNTYTASNNSATFTIVEGAANGCDSLVTLDLTINNVSDLTTSISGAIITANNSGANYQWLDCDNSNATIPGETAQSYTALSNGNYAVELTENGCVDTSACVNIITAAILENNFGSEFSIYPNPTKGNFSVDLDKTYNSVLITITDLTGRLIESKEYNATKLLNLKINEPAGLYLMSIESGDQKAVIRLVKE